MKDRGARCAALCHKESDITGATEQATTKQLVKQQIILREGS